MQLYLIRHSTPAIDKGICYGQTDVPLDPVYFDKACQLIRSKLPDQIDTFYSSPLSRCLHLAQALSPVVIQDDLLMEMNFGDWEMQAWKDIEAEPLNKWMTDFVREPTPGGENYIALHRRSTQFVSQLLKEDCQNVAVVSHAGNIRSLISWALDLPLKNSFRVNIKYGAVIHLTIDKDQQLNQIHL